MSALWAEASVTARRRICCSRSSAPSDQRMAAGAKHGGLLKLCAAVCGLLAVAGLATGCRTSGLLFTKSSGFRVLSPRSNAAVTLPMTIAWSAKGIYRPGDTYAVFLDRGTIRPGQNILSVLTSTCKLDPTCSRPSYYQQANVWLTSKPSLVLSALPEVSLTGHSTGRENHSVTIVLLTSKGARTGEAYASADFVYVRKGT